MKVDDRKGSLHPHSTICCVLSTLSSRITIRLPTMVANFDDDAIALTSTPSRPAGDTSYDGSWAQQHKNRATECVLERAAKGWKAVVCQLTTNRMEEPSTV